MSLAAALQRARTAAAAPAPPPPADVHEIVLAVLEAAARDEGVRRELAGVAPGRALLRSTDAGLAIEIEIADGELRVARAETRGRGPKVDATSATWLGLLGGTLRPWLAFTRGAVVCRAGLVELRWMQQVAERLQRGYAAAGPDDAAR